MAEITKASVSVEYKSGDTEDSGPPALVLERDTNKPPYGEAIARLYYVGPAPFLVSTSGNSVQTVNAQVTSDELDTIIFSGSDKASFPKPGVSNVSLTPLGRFIGMQGETLDSVSLTVDAARGTIQASRVMFGAILASYNSTFNRLQCAYQRIPGSVNNNAYLSEFSPMVLVARQPDGVPVSLDLTPPTKNEKTGTTVMGAADKSTGDAIILEIDSTFPIALAHSTPERGLAAVARVLAYSSYSGVSFSVSKGTVVPDRYGMPDSVERKETVSFIAAQSMSVKYPPANGINALAQGTFTSKVMPSSIVSFATAPQDVATADWHSYGVYTVTGSRPVGRSEIVSLSGGVTVPVTGQVLATYNTMRTWVTVYWTREGEWFPPVVLTATDTYGNTESIVLSPPERRGR